MVQLTMELLLIAYIALSSFVTVKAYLEAEFLKDELYKVQIEEIR